MLARMTNDITTNDGQAHGASARSAGMAAVAQPWARLRGVQPEAHLALAVLENAIDTLRATHALEHARARAVAAETWRWVASDDARTPFAFRWICQHLEIDTAWLRAGLARWRPTSAATQPTRALGPRRRRFAGERGAISV